MNDIVHQEKIGIRVSLSKSSSTSSKMLLQGKYRVALGKDNIPTISTEVLKHIVAVYKNRSNYMSFTPFENMIVFPDDVLIEDAYCSGVFRFVVAEYIKPIDNGNNRIFCSIGRHLSQVISF